METVNNPRPAISPVKTALKWGLISGVVMTILSLVSYYAGMMQNQALQWVSYLLLAVGIFLAVKDHRDKELGGYITYGRSLGTGVLTALFAGLLLAIFIYLFYGMIDPGAMDELKRIQEEQMYKNGMSDEQIEMSLKFVTPGFMAGMALPMVTFMGFIFSLIIAAFMKRNRPMFMDEQE